jgi:F0F1-type ATP synthase alpha subunit
MPSEEQVCVLYAGVRGYLDQVPTSDIGAFEDAYLEHLRSKHSNVLETIRTELQVSQKTDGDI